MVIENINIIIAACSVMYLVMGIGAARLLVGAIGGRIDVIALVFFPVLLVVACFVGAGSGKP